MSERPQSDFGADSCTTHVAVRLHARNERLYYSFLQRWGQTEYTNVQGTEAGLHISPQVPLAQTPEPLIRSAAHTLTLALTGVPQNRASDVLKPPRETEAAPGQ